MRFITSRVAAAAPIAAAVDPPADPPGVPRGIPLGSESMLFDLLLALPTALVQPDEGAKRASLGATSESLALEHSGRVVGEDDVLAARRAEDATGERAPERLRAVPNVGASLVEQLLHASRRLRDFVGVRVITLTDGDERIPRGRQALDET
jgi:hypothetical protein